MSISALSASIAAYTSSQTQSGPYVTAVPGLTLLRADGPTPPMPLCFKPALCLVAQGAKSISFGTTVLDFNAGQARVVGFEKPRIGYVTKATADDPFLGAVLEFDLAVMREVLDEVAVPFAARHETTGLFVLDLDARLTACAVRLLELLETPQAIRTLKPAIMRELSYWLLTSPRGADVASTVFGVDRSEHVIAAINELRGRFAETIRVDELAATARMSTSAFYRAFKTTTSMTPLQYQKQLRLLEARQLMLIDAANAESAAYCVGYASPSQFSRDYARMFGAPPRQDTVSARTMSRPQA